MMFELLKAFTIDLFHIPKESSEDYSTAIYTWRIKLVTIVSILAAAVLTHQLQAYGFMFGSGFATVAEVGEISGKLTGQEIDLVETKICMTPADSVLINYRDLLHRRYVEETGRAYQSKPCEVLLKLQ